MKYYVMTLFPEMFEQVMGSSIMGKAIDQGLIELEIFNIRDFTLDKHNKVDDYPYGGGAGMVMEAEPVLYTEGAPGDRRKTFQSLQIPHYLKLPAPALLWHPS